MYTYRHPTHPVRSWSRRSTPPPRNASPAPPSCAEGSSWEAVARELGTTPEQARRVAETAGPLFRKLRVRAARDVLEDAFAEALFFARLDLRGDDPKLRQHAYQAIFRSRDNLIRHRDRPRGKPAEIRLEDLPEEWRFCIEHRQVMDSLSDEELDRLLRKYGDQGDGDDPPEENPDGGTRPGPGPRPPAQADLARTTPSPLRRETWLTRARATRRRSTTRYHPSSRCVVAVALPIPPTSPRV